MRPVSKHYSLWDSVPASNRTYGSKPTVTQHQFSTSHVAKSYIHSAGAILHMLNFDLNPRLVLGPCAPSVVVCGSPVSRVISGMKLPTFHSALCQSGEVNPFCYLKYSWLNNRWVGMILLSRAPSIWIVRVKGKSDSENLLEEIMIPIHSNFSPSFDESCNLQRAAVTWNRHIPCFSLTADLVFTNTRQNMEKCSQTVKSK